MQGAEPKGASDLRASLAEAARDAVNVSLRAARTALFPRGLPRDPARIVVHCVGNIGDIVALIPSLIGLRERYPRARLSLVTSTGARSQVGAVDLLSGAPYLDEITTYTVTGRSASDLQSLLGAFRKLEPKLLVMLAPVNSPPKVLARNLAFARLTGAEYVVGLELPLLRVWLTDQARKHALFPHDAERMIALLAPLGVRQTPLRFDLPKVPPAEMETVDKLLPRAGFVAICPGGKQTGHLWARERFAAIARRIRYDFDREIVVIGSAGERETCETLISEVGGGINAAGRLSVRGTAELLRRADLLLTNDTGPMHLAAIGGTRVVAIFSSQELAGRWYPLGPGHEVLRARAVCDECLGDPEQKRHCVDTIDVERVWQACLRAMQAPMVDKPIVPGFRDQPYGA